MGILYTSGLCTVREQGRGVIGRPVVQDFRGSPTSNEPRLLRMGVSIAEFNVLDICFIIFHNSSHSRLMGGGGGGGVWRDEW